MEARPLSIPLILGTGRKGRMSAHGARFIHGELQKQKDVLTELIDVASLALRLDVNGEGTADPAFSVSMSRADALVLVAPEYNHAMPGM
jgi:NAD(P)H-dependent FMN reductase